MNPTMKLSSILASSFALVLALSGCSSTDSGSTTSSDNSASSSSTDSSTSSNTTPSNTDSDADLLRVGIDLKYYPFMYQDDSGEPAGLEPEISYAFGEYLGMEVEIVNTDFSMLLPALDTGDIDIIISDMSSNPTRLEKADFSEPYRYGHTVALVNKDFADANNVSDDMPSDEFFAIEDARYVGLSGTVSVTVPLDHGIVVDEVMESATAVLDVARGNYDVVVGSDTIRGDHAANPDTTMVYAGIDNAVGARFVVKKGDTEMLDKANEFIPTLYDDDGLYAQIGTSMDDKIGEFLQDDSLGLEYLITPPA